MANKLNGYLDNFRSGVSNPKGNLADFSHAARLYADNAFRLAPKTKFLFYVVFEFTPEAKREILTLDQKHRDELHMLAKTIDLPQFSSNVETKNQYNRKKNIQTSIEYTPVSIVLHDDNQGITTLLLEAYYRYYFRDSNLVSNSAAGSSDTPARPFNARNSYTPNDKRYRYGLDNDRRTPFFKSIKLYQLARHQFTEFTLVNPLVESWGHDSLDQADGTGITENKLILNYETVLYRRGIVGEDQPAGFASTHYDVTPSPLTVPGGGVSNVFGAGGIFDGGSSVLGEFGSGEADLGTLLTAANTAKNFNRITEEGLIAEGLSIFNTVVTAAGKQTVGGVPGTHFPKDGGSGNTTVATEPGGDATSVSAESKTQSARDQI